jgi:hypothetical protein
MKKIIVVLLLLAAAFSYAQNELLIKMSLKEQIDQSEIVIKGEVIEKQSLWDDSKSMIYTIHKIKVFTQYKGENNSFVYIITKGGFVGNEGLKIYPNIYLSVSDFGIFIGTKENIAIDSHQKNLMYSPVGLNQGFFKIHEGNDEITNTTSTFETLSKLEGEIISHTGTELLNIIIPKENQKKGKSINSSVNIVSGEITSFSPSEIIAGNDSVLTITGNGFGNSNGEVLFKDSNQGGLATVNTLNSSIISWSDTEIKVKVPGDAGTGPLQVKPITGGTFVKNGLIITHAYTTVRTSSNVDEETEFYVHHVATETNGTGLARNINFNGNYEFNFNSDFAANTDAKNTFTSLFDDLVCNTGINFELSSRNVGANTEASDNNNIVSFSSSSSNTALATCYQWFNGIGIFWFFSEMDIIVNETVTWNYSMSDQTQSTEYDFHNVLYHELGHAAGMGHVVDGAKLMHYSVGRGEITDEITTGVHAPINWKANHDANSANPVEVDNIALAECYSLSLDNPEKSNLIVLYNANDFSILSSAIIKKIEIYDITGRLIDKKRLDGTNNFKINAANLNRGVYLIRINTDLSILTSKVVVD